MPDLRHAHALLQQLSGMDCTWHRRNAKCLVHLQTSRFLTVLRSKPFGKLVLCFTSRWSSSRLSRTNGNLGSSPYTTLLMSFPSNPSGSSVCVTTSHVAMPQPFRGINSLKTRDATAFPRNVPIGFICAHQWAASLSRSSSLIQIKDLFVKLKIFMFPWLRTLMHNMV